MMSAIRPHDVVWTPERVGTLWAYYGTNRAYDEQYFSAHAGVGRERLFPAGSRARLSGCRR